MSTRPVWRPEGFTLIEMILFIVIVGAGLAGILGVFTNVVKGSADPVEPKQALMIAEAKLEEILVMNYLSIPGQSMASSQSVKDLVNDIANVDWTAVKDYKYKVSVVSGVAFDPAALSPASGSISVPAASNLRIDVAVTVGTTPFERIYTLTGYRFDYD